MHSIYETLPEAPQVEPRLIWIGNYYDGPISGMVEVDGNLCWAQMVENCYEEEPGCGWYRKYKVMKLDINQILDEVLRYALFVKYVSGHREEGWQFSLSNTQRPRSEWAGYYDEYPPAKYVEPTGEVIGWFVR